MTTFIPEIPDAPAHQVPFYEDNLLDRTIPGRGVEKPVDFYQKQIRNLLLQLGAGLVNFMPGVYPGEPKRYGYQITFSLNGIRGRIDCAALPMRSETPNRKDRALAQGLFLVRSWLEAEVFSYVYRPGAIPLLPYLIGNDGRTVTEALHDTQKLPLLTGGL